MDSNELEKKIDKLLKTEYYGEMDLKYLCEVLSKSNIGSLLDKDKILECYKLIWNYGLRFLLGSKPIVDDWCNLTEKLNRIKDYLNDYLGKLLKTVENLINQDELSAEEKKELITSIPSKWKFMILSSKQIDIGALGLNFEQEYNEALIETVEDFIEYPGCSEYEKTHNWLSYPSYYSGCVDNGEDVNLKGLQDVIFKLETVEIPKEIIIKYVIEVILSCSKLNASEYSKEAGSFLNSISKSEENQMQYSTDSPLKIAWDAIYAQQVSGYGNQQLSKSGDHFEIIYSIMKRIINSPSSNIKVQGCFFSGGNYEPQTKRIQSYFFSKYYKWIIEYYLKMTEEEFKKRVLEKDRKENNAIEQTQTKPEDGVSDPTQR